VVRMRSRLRFIECSSSSLLRRAYPAVPPASLTFSYHAPGSFH
jgi:hypothetical protein